MNVVDDIKRFQAGQLELTPLLQRVLQHTWWVPFDDDIALAQYTPDGTGYLLCFSGPSMDSDYDSWRQLDGPEVLAELEADPEIGVVFDYGYPWALHVKPSDTPKLADAQT